VLEAWVCRELKMSPNSKEVQSLFYEQKVALFNLITGLASNDLISDSNLKKKEITKIKLRPAIDFVPKHYVEVLKRSLKAQGKTEIEINAHINTIAEEAKKREIVATKEKLNFFESEKEKAEFQQKKIEERLQKNREKLNNGQQV